MSVVLRAWKPTDVLGNTLWLDGQDSSTVTKDVDDEISAWNDKSGNNKHVTQGTEANQPVYNTSGINGLNSLTFSGNQFLSGTSALGVGPKENVTMFVVAKPTTSNTGSGVTASYLIDRETVGFSGNGYPLFGLKISNSRWYSEYRMDDDTHTTPSFENDSGVAYVADQTVIMALQRDYSNLTVNLYKNGVVIDTYADQDKNLTMDPIIVGRHIGWVNAGLKGDIGEVFIVNRALTSTEFAQIHSYLSVKYGVTL